MRVKLSTAEEDKLEEDEPKMASKCSISSVCTLVVLTMAIMLVSAESLKAQGKPGDPEQFLLQSANRERAAQRIAPLKWSDALAEAARQHALRMAQQNTLSHQLPGEPGLAQRASQAGARFSTVAENVAYGPDVQGIHQQWMHSQPHRANLLDRELDSVGIAVVDHNGTLFAVEDFSAAVVNLSVREQEKIVEAQLQKLGMHLLDYTEDARRSCLLDNGYAGSHEPSFVLHYATADLQSVPKILEQRIQTGKYHSAVVGACPSNAKLGFSMYRVAVLLFE